jgi:hypothetical protein
MAVVEDSSAKYKNYRLESSQKVIQFEEALKKMGSQRGAARLTGIPRSTYQHLSQRQQRCDLNDIIKDFFRQSEGLDFLHRLTLAAEFVITQLCGGGIGSVQKFYELSQLDKLIANSDGTLCKRISTIENNLISYGKHQFNKLSCDMPSKAVTCALDETFPSGICLVGIEVESNFILLEQFAEKRDCETWHQAMKDCLSALPIDVIQVVSDEAKALVKYTRDTLKAHHSPDVFHVQQDIIKATTPTLRAKVKTARKALKLANNKLNTMVVAEIAYRKCRSIEAKKSVNLARHDHLIDEAGSEQAIAIDNLVEAVSRRETVLEANRSIGQDYHPFDLATGEKRTSQILAEKLNCHFTTIMDNATEVKLSDNAIKRIKKAQRVVDSMILTLQFFWRWVGTYIESLNLSDEMIEIFNENLLPMAYVEAHIPKARNAEQKRQRKELYGELEIKLNALEAWQSTTSERKSELQAHAKKCAIVFQRSSSCVEGRNGQLSLKHHASRKMSSRKLSASTVIHNYFITRQDGTTAAERFFEKAPDNLFEWLLENTDCPPLPAKRRSIPRELHAVA